MKKGPLHYSAIILDLFTSYFLNFYLPAFRFGFVEELVFVANVDFHRHFDPLSIKYLALVQ